MDALKAEFAKNKRYQLPFSCMLIDIDDFKHINDNYGHLMGDIVLQELSRIIKANLREVDVFGRYGGEEFLIILPNIEVADAAPVAEKIRTRIAQTRFDCAGDEISITLSLGLLDSTNSQLTKEDDLLQNVDTALYEAKRKGKNCYVIFQGP
jgi:diguanylate cyclase (GGDEF)-like protein